MVKNDITIELGKVVANIAFKQCEKCSKKDECFKDYTGVCKTIEMVMNCFKNNTACVSSAATIELMKMMREQKLKEMI
jgi:hypothetical protein